MPLVFVSADYLRACQAKVVWLVEDLTEDTNLDRKEATYAETCHLDEGEDSAAIRASFDSLDQSNEEEW